MSISCSSLQITLMTRKMRKSAIAVLLLVVLGYVAWQMSAVIYSDFVSRSSSESGPLTNMSRRAKLKRTPKTKPICVDGVCHARQRHIHRALTFDADQFYLDGKPLRILSGSFHYFRTQPHQWIDRLERLKAAGLNTVSTYVPWNLHEKIRGKFNFFGRWRLFSFIKLVEKMGLHMILRPGPFICAEWDMGGMPSWLLHDPNMTVRTSKYKPYLDHVELYFHQLLPHLVKYGYRNGGPIIAFQIENEYGNYDHDDDYLNFLVGLYKRHGIEELLLTSDPISPERLERGSLPGLLATVNFNKYPLQALERLRKFQPNRPLMVMEFWPGWFDTWGQPHRTMPVVEFIKTVDVILSMNASINFYMFVGGTNFGFWNGASYDGRPQNRYLPTTTSYDYDALVSESGNCHPTKYKALRLLLLKHKLISHSLPPIPRNPPKTAYGTVMITEVLRMDDFLTLLPHKPVTLANPVFMEYLNVHNRRGQSFGWILYRTTFDFGNNLHLQGYIHNRAQVFLNGQSVKVIFNSLMTNISESILVELKSLKNKGNRLEILVENMGRVSGWKFDEQRRGFQGTVTVNGNLISAWEHVSLDFTDDFLTALSKWKHWKPYVAEAYPAAYRGYLTIHNLQDTFLDMRQWTKGIAIINGYNVGRFWNVGPQQTLYIPKPLLRKGKNEIIIFELEKPTNKLNFIAEAILDNVTAPIIV